MNIVTIRCCPYHIPMRENFVTAHSTHRVREGAVVEVITDDGKMGMGEIAPLPEFGGGDLNDALASLSRGLPQLHETAPEIALDHIYAWLEAGTMAASTAYGLETALLDLLGKAQQCSVSSLLWSMANKEQGLSGTSADLEIWLNTIRSHVPVNAVIGTYPIETTIAKAQEAVSAGFRCIKLKVGKDTELEIARIAAVRQAIGSTIHLRLDANEGWSFEQACTILTACAQFDIQYVEQPLCAGDVRGMHMLREAVSVPIAADEALNSSQSARQLLTMEAVDVFIVKPQLAGGLRASQQIIQEAGKQGVQCVITSTMEAGIGVVAALHLVAATPQLVLESGLATLPLLENDLLLQDLFVQEGKLALPEGPGLGVQLDSTALARYTYSMGGVR